VKGEKGTVNFAPLVKCKASDIQPFVCQLKFSKYFFVEVFSIVYEETPLSVLKGGVKTFYEVQDVLFSSAF
jgi:hypothetical protein